MEHFKDYFKNRQEVQDFFGSELFKFSFMSDNTIFFDTLSPRIINDVPYNFQLSFYYDYGKDFFNYSGFHQWMDVFQLSEVICKSDIDNERETMYFSKYEDPNLN